MDCFKKSHYKFSLKDAFPMFLDDFIADFSFEDIAPYVNQEHKIFTEEECAQLLSAPKEKHQVILLFFFLIERGKNLRQFLRILRLDYNWLREKILNSEYEDSPSLASYLNEVHLLRSHFPKHSDYNVHRIQYYCTVRDYLLALKSREYLVIYGELGFGKKWLALDVCCDFGVMKSTGYKVFWLDVHNCDSQEMDLEKLQRLKILLGQSSYDKKIGDYEGMSNKILELQQDLRNILKEDEFKDCILVLTDVQNKRTLEAFYLPCKIVITTRNKQITDGLPKKETKSLKITEGLTHSESISLFEKVLEKEQLPSNPNDLIELSRGHPFLLNLIAQNLKGQSLTAWNDWIKNLEDFQIQNDKIIALIEHSLRVLRTEELEIYKTLSIFCHSVQIPVSVLASFWKMRRKEAEALVQKFDKFSLLTVQTLESDEIFCTLHLLYFTYLKNCHIDRKNLNRLLVESYKIEEALEKRTELDLVNLPDDKYFHYFIAYHLKHSDMAHLFPVLFLDFGFLSQKLRATGLPNTIGDLKLYRNEITENDPHKEEFVDRLLEFLPNIEEMIFKSCDTDLLQYALNRADDVIKTEALKQASHFPERVWFSDSDHFHRRRQMVRLGDSTKVVRLIEPDTCLIGLESNIIFLADLSCDYYIEPTCFSGHTKEITTIERFLKDYFISLDVFGELKVWSFADEKRRSVKQKIKHRRIAKQVDYSNCPKDKRQKKCLQTIKYAGGDLCSIKSFYIETVSSFREPEVYLYLAFNNGDIHICKWWETHKSFKKEIIPALKTKMLNIRFTLKILNRIIVLNNCGSLGIYNCKDGSTSSSSCEWTAIDNPIAYHRFQRETNMILILVFAHKIIEMTIPCEQNFDFLMSNIETLYDIGEKHNYITCSALTEDNKYLIIGTRHGILVFDAVDKSEVLRNSISEHIVCIDVCALDDEIFKYLIVSGSEKRKLVNIFGLKCNGNRSITWANSIGNLLSEEDLNLRFEPSAWLLGKKLFDVFIDPNDAIALVAVDSKNRIHHLENNKWSMILPQIFETDESEETIENVLSPPKITSVLAFRNNFFFGCENGEVFNSVNGKIESDFIKNSVAFLKMVDSNVLVASDMREKSVIHINGETVCGMSFPVMDCWVYHEKYLVLIALDCALLVVNILDHCTVVADAKGLNEPLGSCDFKKNQLVIGTKKSKFYIYKFIIEGEFKIIQHQRFIRETYELIPSSSIEKTCGIPSDVVTSLCVTSDCNYCAVGYHSGSIEIYKLEQTTWKQLQVLKSHRSAVHCMQFSSCADHNLPIVLASISEQLCFWNVSYVINNPLDQLDKPRRHSSRFSSNYKVESEKYQTNGNSLTVPTNGILQNAWSNKRGPSDKPELLSCIKLAGNRAEKFYTNSEFTKFITIDDEGELYSFAVQEIQMVNGHKNGHHQHYSCNGNGNGVEKHNSIDSDDVII